MPYPSPITYPSPTLYPGFYGQGECEMLVALGDDVILGATDDRGVKFTVPTFDGWDGSPAPTLTLTQRGRGHGATGSESFLTPRYLKAEGFIHAPTHSALRDAMDRLNGAVKLDEFVLIVAHDTSVRHAVVRRQGENIIKQLTDKLASYSILMSAEDSRKFGDLVSVTTRLPFSEGGLIRPSTWPRTWTGVSHTGKVSITNPGNEQAPVWLRLDGPLPAGGHAVSHAGSKRTLTFATQLALGPGEFITVDMDRKEVLAQGIEPRQGYVSSRGWFTLDPGENEVSFTSVNYSAAANLTVTTKPSWS